MIRMPIALPPRASSRANDWLTITTSGVESVSRGENSRPSTRGMPIVAK